MFCSQLNLFKIYLSNRFAFQILFEQKSHSRYCEKLKIQKYICKNVCSLFPLFSEKSKLAPLLQSRSRCLGSHFDWLWELDTGTQRTAILFGREATTIFKTIVWFFNLNIFWVWQELKKCKCSMSIQFRSDLGLWALIAYLVGGSEPKNTLSCCIKILFWNC